MVIVAACVVWAHRENIRKLAHHEEKRFSFHHEEGKTK
jgi:glycerol-3-phosphate acyltransferase PlsY